MKKELTRTFKTNDYINLFTVSDLDNERKIYPERIFNTEVKQGIRTKLVYPVREDFLVEEEKKNSTNYLNELYENRKDCNKLYSDFQNPKVEFSGFWFVPTYISFWSENCIVSEKDSKIDLEIGTKNKIIIWLNDQLIEVFTPYDLHNLSEKIISLNLKKGDNKLIIFCDQLAERNVEFFYSIKNINNFPIKCKILSSSTNEDVSYMETVLNSAFLTRDNYDLNNSEISFLLYGKIALNENYYFDGVIRSVENKCRGTYWSVETNLINNPIEDFIVFDKIKDGKLILDNVANYNPGVYDIFLRYGNKETRVSTKVTAEFYPLNMELYKGLNIKDRKYKALEMISVIGDDTVGKALAMLEVGKVSESITLIEKLLIKIEERYDCADFEMPVLIFYYTLFCKKEPTNIEFQNKLKGIILNFRYWLDEPGNDVIWYFSENHALMFHTSQYIAGKLFPNEIFNCSNRTGSEQKKIGEERLLLLLDEFIKYGLSEWNSSSYIPIDFIGLFSILLLDENSLVVTKTKSFLEILLKTLFQHNYKGAISSTYGRSYTKSLLGSRTMGTSFLLWILTGEGFINQNSWAESLLCFLDSELIKYDSSKYSIPATIKETQDKLQVTLTDYITESYKLSSIKDFYVYDKGEQEHVNQISFGVNPVINFWINHPGELTVHGESRPSFWSGNGLIPFQYQNENLLLVHYKITENFIPFTHLYAPLYDLDDYRLDKKRFYAKSGDSYLFVECSQKLELVNHGASAYREVRAYGNNITWIVICSDNKEFKSFKSFQEYYSNDFITFEENLTTLSDTKIGEIVIEHNKI